MICFCRTLSERLNDTPAKTVCREALLTLEQSEQQLSYCLEKMAALSARRLTVRLPQAQGGLQEYLRRAAENRTRSPDIAGRSWQELFLDGPVCQNSKALDIGPLCVAVKFN